MYVPACVCSGSELASVEVLKNHLNRKCNLAVCSKQFYARIFFFFIVFSSCSKRDEKKGTEERVLWECEAALGGSFVKTLKARKIVTLGDYTNLVQFLETFIRAGH